MKKLFIYVTVMAVVCATVIVVNAKTYNIDWFTIGGGGSTSTGGVYSVSGTIGQPDASGASTGGVYSVTGGFWPGVNVVQTPGGPLLSIEPQPAVGGVRIFWPLPASGFVLEQTTSLTPPPVGPGWPQVSYPYTTNATQISIFVTPGGNKFYRLRKP